MRLCKLLVLVAAALLAGSVMIAPHGAADAESSAVDPSVDEQLASVLKREGFTGNIEARLEEKMGRPIKKKLAELGRLLFFDSILSLNGDNSCAGCHSPTTGFGDTQSIAIGIDNNGTVGPNRAGPRNQRRSPIVINAAFYRSLMWNSRFASLARNPFNNQSGFRFPEPEGLGLSHLPHLLAAQVFLPPTSRAEMAGFDFAGDNFAMRAELLNRLNEIRKYRKLFKKVFAEVKQGGEITFEMVGQAIAEFEFTLTFANAPIDRFARGERDAMTGDQKQGALLFFGKAKCVKCHAVSGDSNEMFSDFGHFVVGIPQVCPSSTNAGFDGPGKDEDYGLEQVTTNPADRYRFRTSPLRNVAMQPAFFHNGAFTTLEDAVRHYLDVFKSARSFEGYGLAPDLSQKRGPIEPVLARVDSLLATPITLTEDEFKQLVEFVRNGLLDPRAKPENLRNLIPESVPSGRPVPRFE